MRFVPGMSVILFLGIKTSREVPGWRYYHPCGPSGERRDSWVRRSETDGFAGVYPIDSEDFENLRASLEKLQLNDASLTFQPESSAALGFGFRCGFLGLLHMDVIQERLEREFNIDLIMTAPSVVYHVNTTDGEMLEVSNPSEFPDPTRIDAIEEPYVKRSNHGSSRICWCGYGVGTT